MRPHLHGFVQHVSILVFIFAFALDRVENELCGRFVIGVEHIVLEQHVALNHEREHAVRVRRVKAILPEGEQQ